MTVTALRQWPASHARRGVRQGQGGCCALRVLPDGHWEITSFGQTLHAELVQVWPAWGWTSLHFSIHDQPKADRGVRLTVWRHRTSAAAWRELRVIMARQAAIPGRVMDTEGT